MNIYWWCGVKVIYDWHFHDKWHSLHPINEYSLKLRFFSELFSFSVQYCSFETNIKYLKLSLTPTLLWVWQPVLRSAGFFGWSPQSRTLRLMTTKFCGENRRQQDSKSPELDVAKQRPASSATLWFQNSNFPERPVSTYSSSFTACRIEVQL